MPTVLITRPALVSASTIEACRARGHTVLAAPLITIVPTGAVRPALPRGQLRDGSAVPARPIVILTSRSACEVLAQRKSEAADLLSAVTYCVGERTAAAARAMGFTDIRRVCLDSAALADVIVKQERSSATLMPIGGKHRESAAFERLAAAGFTMRPWEIYEAVAAESMPEELRGWLARGTIDAALFYSPRSARIFSDLVNRAGLTACCRGIRAVGLSRPVCAALSLLPFRECLCAKQPTENDMLARLGEGE